MRKLATLLLVVLSLSCGAAIAQSIPDLVLNDQRGQRQRLSELGPDLVSLFVYRVDDPTSQMALADLQSLRSQFQRRGVEFLLISATDSAAAINADPSLAEIDLGVLLDSEGEGVRSLGLTLTGEALVIDTDTLQILYRGPVNDRVNSLGAADPARNHFLRDALNNILLGVSANFAVPPVQGSPINDPQTGADRNMTNPEIRQFSIDVPDQALDDLKARLALTRYPDQIADTSWEYGTDTDYLRELIDYWRDEFDWRSQERMLNAFDHFRTEIEGLDLHFIHQRSPDPEAIPLLVVHGWPGSVAEFYKIIGPLTDPAAHGAPDAQAFHVIAPSLPGFGFSARPDEPGYSPEKIGHLLAALMERLGYTRYGLQGGDWGAIINRYIAANYPDRLIGLHSNFVLAGNPGDDIPVSAAELELRTQREAYMANERGYQQIQGTKPQTLGYGLNDSPAGLAAWIVEKFHGWSDLPQDERGDLDAIFSKDELLTNISIYWFTSTITSSMRIYYENRNAPRGNPIGFITVPTGGAIFPAEISVPPRSWAERGYNIVHWTMMPRGGHFAAMEQPELLVIDVRAFFSKL